MGFAALIVAAGRGTRAGGGMPKQYRDLDGRPMLARTLEQFLTHPDLDMACVVIHPDDNRDYASAVAGLPSNRLLPPVHGDATRAGSVRRGLDALAPHGPDRVLIHDAARPFVSHAVIDRVHAALDLHAAVCPGLPIVDALWRTDGGHVRAGEPRDGLWRAQTPQGFRYDDIARAHRTADAAAADDIAVAQAAGLATVMVLGDGNNFKITLAEDFDRAERLMGQDRDMDIRTGNGFDVHAFGDGDRVVLCGVEIPHGRALAGHSDADVGMHAITDAIFGALAEGDIGQWFPPSDPEWKGANSVVFLAKAVERAADRGYRITHVDCTLICEAPKIGPHAQAMREAIGGILGIAPERVSIKATTSERLGFTGRGEGIAAMATATLVGG